VVKKLKTKLRFEFGDQEEVPSLDYDIPFKTKDKECNKINIVKKKKNGRDTSTNRLF
jgi:hypothetical protein